ncbi:MAG: dienelactone hydrolase family protein [Desulfobacterales bacterium]|jgi:carboxymethylenebutenolidase|nr:dienelactone hydrolase family protein [Desulfobacterales bacterium]
MEIEKDWIANAYEGMSRRQFMAKMTAAGAAIAGFAIASRAVAGEIIRTPAAGLKIAEGQVASGGSQVPIYTARPAASGKYPVVVVIPEIWGMHEYIKDVVRRFAQRGFLAITFEPYARTGGVLHIEDREALLKVVNAVPDAQVMADLDAIVAHAKKHESARADRIGVTGFCRGGLYTMLFSAHSAAVAAAVVWYGQIKPAKNPAVRSVGPLDVAGKIQAPLLGLFGGADAGIPVADVREFEAALKAAGRTAEIVIYEHAPHAFHADYRPSYRENEAKDAWARCLAWFDRYLKG